MGNNKKETSEVKLVEFKLEGSQELFKQIHEPWAKHHKTIGAHVIREYSDGRKVLPESDEAKKYIEANKEHLKKKHIKCYDRKQDALQDAIDYYLTLNNTTYQEPNIDYYDVGSSNTEQSFAMRLSFLVEDVRIIFDYNFKSNGSNAFSFYDLLSGNDAVRDIIHDIIAEEKPFGTVGITKGQDEDYIVVGVDKVGDHIEFGIDERELLNAFIGVELYNFTQTITD